LKHQIDVSSAFHVSAIQTEATPPAGQLLERLNRLLEQIHELSAEAWGD
jgi:hypothetical protein